MTAENREAPQLRFADFDLPSELNRAIEAMGWESPRPIQVDTIPPALDEQDILGLAQTGTGKTAAFALPALEMLIAEPGRRGDPRVLIVAPTRELAAQIKDEIDALARFTEIKTVTLFGGVSIAKQRAELSKKPEIVVACPGRLLDLHGQGLVRLDRVEILVLDEADHMFDMGFLPDVRRILRALPRERQNLLFSATMPKEIRGLADEVLYKPHVSELGHSRPASTIAHALCPVDDKRKLDLLRELIAMDDFSSAIVFTRTKHRARRLAQQLEKSGLRAVALQGNMSQNARERAMGGFREKQFDILVATDIAARGIDVEQVSHVINFDMPGTPDAYMHRIGRTGRAERTGQAYTFVTDQDDQLVRAVEKRIGHRLERCTFESGGRVDQPVKELLDESRPARPRSRRPAGSRASGDTSGAPSSRRRRRRRGGGSAAGASSGNPARNRSGRSRSRSQAAR